MTPRLLTLTTFGWGAQTIGSVLPIWWILFIVVAAVVLILRKAKLRESLEDREAEASDELTRDPEREDPNFPRVEIYRPRLVEEEDILEA